MTQNTSDFLQRSLQKSYAFDVRYENHLNPSNFTDSIHLPGSYTIRRRRELCVWSLSSWQRIILLYFVITVFFFHELNTFFWKVPQHFSSPSDAIFFSKIERSDTKRRNNIFQSAAGEKFRFVYFIFSTIFKNSRVNLLKMFRSTQTIFHQRSATKKNTGWDLIGSYVISYSMSPRDSISDMWQF